MSRGNFTGLLKGLLRLRRGDDQQTGRWSLKKVSKRLDKQGASSILSIEFSRLSFGIPAFHVLGEKIPVEGIHVTDHWKGWIDIPHVSEKGKGAWIDLSHPMNKDLSRIPFFPQPNIRRIFSMPQNPLNVTEIQIACHVGTHVDAPRHFFQDGPTFDVIPLERLYGPGVVWRIEAPPYGLIEPTDFEKMKPPCQPGDIVILDTGWAKHFGKDLYDHHPSLSLDAAHWLVEHRIKLLAVDFATPDLAVNQRKPDFNWPIHHILLGHGVLVSEHLTHLGSISGRRMEAIFLALNIDGADGAPARVIARPTE